MKIQTYSKVESEHIQVVIPSVEVNINNFYSVTLKILFWVFRHKNNYTEVKKTSLQVTNTFYTVTKADDEAGGGEPAQQHTPWVWSPAPTSQLATNKTLEQMHNMTKF